jgi:hypothetical protein
MFQQVVFAELLLLPQYVSQQIATSCDLTMSHMCNSQLLLYLKMLLIENISTHQAGNKEGGREGRKEQMKEAHLYTHMLHMLRYIRKSP